MGDRFTASSIGRQWVWGEGTRKNKKIWMLQTSGINKYFHDRWIHEGCCANPKGKKGQTCENCGMNYRHDDRDYFLPERKYWENRAPITWINDVQRRRLSNVDPLAAAEGRRETSNPIALDD